MKEKYLVVFDEEVKNNLQKLIFESNNRNLIRRWLDELEKIGPAAGKLLDNHFWLYEMKNKHPPLRLYYYFQKTEHKIIIFEVEMKTNVKKQENTITKLRYKLSRFQYLFVCTLFSLDFPNTQEVVYRV